MFELGDKVVFVVPAIRQGEIGVLVEGKSDLNYYVRFGKQDVTIRSKNMTVLRAAQDFDVIKTTLVPPVSTTPVKSFGSSKNYSRVFEYLKLKDDGLTADEAAVIMELEDGDGKPKVNRVAPVFTHFKQAGLTRTQGKRVTRNGSEAHVHILLPNASLDIALQL